MGAPFTGFADLGLTKVCNIRDGEIATAMCYSVARSAREVSHA